MGRSRHSGSQPLFRSFYGNPPKKFFSLDTHAGVRLKPDALSETGHLGLSGGERQGGVKLIVTLGSPLAR
ncbi:hypothetical protein L596_026956 [Steinernema carpocapsae]|uniref:Uncharacterized protein n=1 Tax=Steinernema carpocapsae TaxID=34508 RepID=A0A4U5M2W3_STECR|nr:hypothetical protein L596_026956 [Steinernema carpocapsae]